MTDWLFAERKKFQDLQPFGGVRPSPLSIAVTALGPQMLLPIITNATTSSRGRADVTAIVVLLQAAARSRAPAAQL